MMWLATKYSCCKIIVLYTYIYIYPIVYVPKYGLTSTAADCGSTGFSDTAATTRLDIF